MSKANVDLVFDTLRQVGIAAEWIWADTLEIPGGGSTATAEDKLLTTNIINALSAIYSNATAVIIFDALVLQLHAESIVDVAVAILCGKWSTLVETWQEIKLAREATIITANAAYDYKQTVTTLKRRDRCHAGQVNCDMAMIRNK
jgi:hypothetical protein